MPITLRQAKTPAVAKLIRVWRKRYTPDLASLSPAENTLQFRQQLITAASLTGRRETASILTERVLANQCKVASRQANSLYSSIPNIINFHEAHRLWDLILQIYCQLTVVYQQPSPTLVDRTDTLAQMIAVQQNKQAGAEKRLSMKLWGLPSIEQFTIELKPLLVELLQQAPAADWRSVSYVTTLLNFTTRLILSELSRPEQIIVYPYFRFIEEQVAIPWHRVCLAGARYFISSPKFAIVEQCLAQSQSVSCRVYNRLSHYLPQHALRRHLAHDSATAQACRRDLEMFQTYFWLYFLEDDLSPVENELIPLCTALMAGLSVDWGLIELWNQFLFEEILREISSSRASRVRPYANAFIQAFARQQGYFQQLPPLPATQPTHWAASTEADSLSQAFPPSSDDLIWQSSNSSGKEAEAARLVAKLALLDAEMSRTRRQLKNLQG